MAKLNAKTIAATVATLSLAATMLVKPFEGKRNVTYLDPIGIPTACYGHTGPTVRVGQVNTDAQCNALLEVDLASALADVDRCTPNLATSPRAAFTSLAFNIGGAKYCASSLAKKANAGDLRGACAELSRWVYAAGKPLNGLIKRRAAERAICEQDMHRRSG
ncbi:lysozyme [Deefgea sp. CFH1-16]|uniref:lysozyme n=1 Tax=Deefgea sp. CFH1-16 TaxID=2675457 RepID=UPI0015F4D8C3|nr:lysozyme [Deefgea sp. CFH1-16]MBM5575847.1 glycoside hydrolase family protein [Deefgea sp. CFH1-16]